MEQKNSGGETLRQVAMKRLEGNKAHRNNKPMPIDVSKKVSTKPKSDGMDNAREEFEMKKNNYNKTKSNRIQEDRNQRRHNNSASFEAMYPKA